MKLYSFWRSSAAYRARIGLALKGLAYDYAPVNLRAGEQNAPAYRAIQPQGLVPALEADGDVFPQSLAILEWLDETHPAPPFLPKRAADRAMVRAMAYAVACDIHPLNNLRVLKYLRTTLHADKPAVAAYQAHWIGAGFEALERMVETHGGGYCFGDAPTLADICLVPQIANAAWLSLDMRPYPRLAAINARARAHPAFEAAAPENQPDVPEDG
ncbi:MAG TPA: maleylacetoacetate isomerase [Caulobacterales bacterium]|nr:maleylacetoacetate isomerase [Caulobacterales bacterium]